MDLHYYIEYQGNSVELPLGETIVGRDVGCRLRFNDPSVSRKHLRFIRRAGEVFVEDLRSSNGTRLNGRPVLSPTRVDDGDEIAVGGRTLIVRVSDEAMASSDTLLLHQLGLDPRTLRTTHTQPMAAVTIPPQHKQRCPSCGAVVTDIDDECANCGHQWGGFRAASPTDVRKVVTQRRHDRHPVELHLVYVSSELEIEATTRDLSPSGVFVCSQVLDPVGTRCRLTFLVDGGPPFEIDGIVRRVVTGGDEETGIGVEFSRVGKAERTWLDTTIARLSK